MKAIPINTDPDRTVFQDPVEAYAAAVEIETGHPPAIGTLYRFRKTLVRFWTHQRRLGAEFLVPVSGKPGVWRVTRFNTVGNRVRGSTVRMRVS